jgi:predicted nucleotidyltransferase
MLSVIFGSKLRAKVLGWLFMHPDERYYSRQLQALLGEDSTNIGRELARLEKTGIIICSREGRRKYYQANRACPVFSELESLARKTSGLADVLQDTLKPLSGQIAFAFIYGSMAKGVHNSRSDVDLMVVGSCSFAQVVEALMTVQAKLDREVNPSVYPLEEFKKKLAAGHHFVKNVVAGPKIFLIGEEHELAGLASE